MWNLYETEARHDVCRLGIDNHTVVVPLQKVYVFVYR